MKSKLKKAGRMPEVSKSVQIAKCTRCHAFRRLADISAGVCVDTLVCKATVDLGETLSKAADKYEPVVATSLGSSVSPSSRNIMEPCANCDEWTDRKELELSEQHWCQACTVERGAE